jgi:arylsulfatase A-like enzyme
MKKRWMFLGAVAALGVAGWAAFERWKIYLPGLVSELRDPVQPTQAIAWQRGPAAAERPPAERPPNIILIVADDLGINDISAFGGGIVPTPAIDRLMKEGATVDAFYTANATCSPSRAAMMTGRYPTRFGFEFTSVPARFASNIVHGGTGLGPHRAIFHGDRAKGMLPYEAQGMPASEVTIAEALGAAGYHNVHLGKWHLGMANGMRPEEQGFHESLGIMAGADLFDHEDSPGVVNAKLPWDPIDRFIWANAPFAVQYNGGQRFHPDRHVTDYYTEAAVSVIKANRNRPFFLYLAHPAPHTPLQAAKADYDALGHIPDHRDRVYAGMIRGIDRSVATILETLKAEGLEENTLILFTSDNGGAWYVGMEGLNRPYRGWKATFFEGGIRAPLFLHWPGRVPAGTRMTGTASHLDLFATISEAAGARLPADRPMDSLSLLPFATTGTGLPARTHFWRSGDYRAVRDGDWKLQVSARPNRVWLHNLADDPTERRDLSAAMPEKVRALRAKIDAHEAGMPPPLWPALVEGPIRIDVPQNAPWEDGQDLIYWSN